MKVLSLFDGISCGMVALLRANIPVDKYVAYEIDPYAIKISQDNYPNIEHAGSVCDADFSQYIGFDLLIGGSPCQDLSNYKISAAGGRGGLSGDKSRLFFEYVRALRQAQPRYFLFENVATMSSESREVITEELGVQPIYINSSWVSPCERRRLYWTNIPQIGEIEKRETTLRDIVLDCNDVEEKYWYRDRDFVYNGDDQKIQCTMIGPGFMRNTREVYNLDGQSNTLLCDGDGGNRTKKVFQNGMVRKLTPVEYERLQTLPDNYTRCVSDSRRYTAIGNGWTVDVIAHLLKGLSPDNMD